MKFSEKSIMTFAGSIRGAIAFGLAISIDSKNKKIKQVLVSSTLVLVFITTILFGGLMPLVINFFKGFESKKEETLLSEEKEQINSEENEEENKNKFVDFSHPNFKKTNKFDTKEKDMNILRNRLSYWLVNYWQGFDEDYMKKRLIHDWPNCNIQNEELSQKIENLADEYSEEFKKRENKPLLVDEYEKINSERNSINNEKNSNNDFEMRNIVNHHLNNNFNNFSSSNNHVKTYNQQRSLKVAFDEKNFEDYSPNTKKSINFFKYF